MLFTATRAVTQYEIIQAVKKIPGVVMHSVEIEPEGYEAPEPGDPADLM